MCIEIHEQHTYNHLKGFLRFLSEFYNRLQWETCCSSKSIVEAAPPLEILRRFYQKDGDAAEMEIAESIPDLIGLHFVMDETSATYEQGEVPFPEIILDEEFDKKLIEKYHLVTKEMEEGTTE